MLQEKSPERNEICVICQGPVTYEINRGRKNRLTCKKACTSELKRRRLDEKRVNFTCCVCGIIKRVPKSRHVVTCGKRCQGKYLSQKYSGRKLTEEWKHKQNIAKRAENVRRLGDFDCETCGRRFLSNTSLRSHHATCHATSVIFGEFVCQLCDTKLSSSRAFKKHVKLVHGDPVARERRINLQRERAANRVTQSRSKGECLFYDVIIEFILDAKHSHKIEGCSHQFDIFIPSHSLLLEYDGDYWHGNKVKYPIRSVRMKRQRAIDVTYSNFACQTGYRVVRIWECDAYDFLRELREAFNAGNEVFESFIDKKRWVKRSIRHPDKKEP